MHPASDDLLKALIMKKTFSLLGLLLIGLMLLTNPATGIVLETETESDVAASVATTTVNGDPPAESEDEEEVVTAEAATATSSEPTTTTEAIAEEEASESFSVVGSAEESGYGTFQVEVFFADGEIVAVEALQLPTDRKSNAINNSAVPTYAAAVIDAQSADIDVISGATVTWENYTDSLQSALDEVSVVA